MRARLLSILFSVETNHPEEDLTGSDGSKMDWSLSAQLPCPTVSPLIPLLASLDWPHNVQHAVCGHSRLPAGQHRADMQETLLLRCTSESRGKLCPALRSNRHFILKNVSFWKIWEDVLMALDANMFFSFEMIIEYDYRYFILLFNF